MTTTGQSEEINNLITNFINVINYLIDEFPEEGENKQQLDIFRHSFIKGFIKELEYRVKEEKKNE